LSCVDRKHCSPGGLQGVRSREAWVERLLELSPGHPISSKSKNSAACRIGLRGRR
jgi:hypothetical protein